jgi:Ion transport protein
MPKRPVLDFVPCPLSHIPKPLIEELKIIFNDLGDGDDNGGRKYLLPEEVRAGFAVNAIDIRDEVVDAALMSMDPGRTGKINFEGFATCMYALSIQSRKVRNASKYAVFPDSDFTVETASRLFRTRRLIWKLLEDPASSPLARTIAFFLSAVVLLSVASFLAESYPEVRMSNEALFSGIELSCVLVFTVEYILRLTCTPELSKFFFSFYNMVDLLSIAPYYLELILDDTGSSLGSGAPLLRAVRLIRILRLIKLGRYVAWMRIFGATVEKSASPLGLLAFMAAIMIILWSSLGYFVERGEWDATIQNWINPETGAPSFINSIPSAFWWAIVSMTTVGYGDTYAVTGWGRLVSGAAILTGVALFAIPISIVTSNLHAEYDRMDKLRALRAAHEAQPIPLPLAALAALQQQQQLEQQEQIEMMAAAAVGGPHQLEDGDGMFLQKENDAKGLLKPGDFDLPSPPSGSIRGMTSKRFATPSGGGAVSSTEDAAANKAKLSETLLKASLSSANLSDLAAAAEASNIVARNINEKSLPVAGAGVTGGAGGGADDKRSPRLSLFGNSISPSFRAKPGPSGSPLLQALAGKTPPLSSRSEGAGSDATANITRRLSTKAGSISHSNASSSYFDGVHVVNNEKDPYQKHLVRQSLVEIAAETSGGVFSHLADDLDSVNANDGPFTLDSKMDIVRRDAGFGSSSKTTAIGSGKERGVNNAPSTDGKTGGSSSGPSSSSGATGGDGKTADSLDFDLGPPAVPAEKLPHEFHTTLAPHPPPSTAALAVVPALELALPTAGKPFVLQRAPSDPGNANNNNQQQQDVELPQSSLEDRLDASWSEPFLRSALQVIRGNRRRLMSGLKALELKNREHAVEDVKDFIGDMHEEDRIKALLQAAQRSGFA